MGKLFAFRQYIPLEAAEFGVETYELCESSLSMFGLFSFTLDEA
jgi:hypothetical protein